ncbi:MAG: asparagine synthase (glutamine-hydrolyzing) [Fluviicola sp.]|nr:MAG: asparagine synthase (glutamine-hydrolyzing) [Fluviicola sp.]
MCGIGGIVSFTNSISNRELEDMSKAIAHRGPDADGLFLDGSKVCGLVHRRLSIIDITDNANQPMTSENGRYTIVFNGELYNFEDLREELKTLDYKFFTASDTEVVLNAFIQWGSECVDRFNGMFAFAIWDEKVSELYLFRDRIGIKPLYYIKTDEVFAFASEIKALLPLAQDLSWNNEVVHHFFRLGYVPEPQTIYKHINKFPKGNAGFLSENSFEIKRYWNINEKVKKSTVSDFSIAKNEYHKTLKESIRLRLKSDVPFGVFLSGGIDSSTVAAVAQSQTKEKINTFSIGFKENKFNESEYAKKVANHLGTNHHEYTLSEKDAQELIELIPSWYSEPFADTSAIPTYLVAKMASESVKMVLTGDGGDEQFLGYGMYEWASRLSSSLIKSLKSPMVFALSNSGKIRLQRASEYFRFDKKTALHTHIFSVDQYYYSERETKSFFHFETDYSELQISKVARKLSPRENQALFDLNYYLTDDLLTKVDRATMLNGVEARVPLLDHHLIECSLNMDESLKVNKGESKLLLKEILYEYVPKEYFDRPKWGFGIPLQKWLSNELKPLLDKYVNQEILQEVGIYNVPKIVSLKEEYLGGKSYLYNKLWLVIVFNIWFKSQEKNNYLK